MDFQIILASVIAIALLILLFTVKLRYLMFNALLGFTALILVNILSVFTNIGLGYGPYTLLYSAVLGVPAVISMVIINLL